MWISRHLVRAVTVARPAPVALELQRERDRVIHSIALFGRQGWYGLHPKSRTLVPTDTGNSGLGRRGSAACRRRQLHEHLRLAACSGPLARQWTERRLRTIARSQRCVTRRITPSRLQPPIPSNLGQPNSSGGEGAGRDVGGGSKTLRMQHGRFDGPPNDDDGRGFIGLDQLDSQCVDGSDLA